MLCIQLLPMSNNTIPQLGWDFSVGVTTKC